MSQLQCGAKNGAASQWYCDTSTNNNKAKANHELPVHGDKLTDEYMLHWLDIKKETAFINIMKKKKGKKKQNKKTRFKNLCNQTSPLTGTASPSPLPPNPVQIHQWMLSAMALEPPPPPPPP